MSNLYGKKMAFVFDKIYQGFIDYDEEFHFYASMCKAKRVKSVLEIGCGSGNLSKKFNENFETYEGLDLSNYMLDLAKQKCSSANFLQADMRNFSTVKAFDAVLITGRSTSYLITDSDLFNTFACVHRALLPKGHFIFDCIDASRFLPYIVINPVVEHRTSVENIEYKRNSKWHLEKNEKKIVKWSADYFRLEKAKEVLLGNDNVVFRAFYKAEIMQFLNDAGFEVVDVIDRKTYAFDTFVIVAQKG